MPFPRTWAEELVAEWLQLDGFLAQTNLPVCVSRAGGRFEADVIGARIKAGILEIRHIETGQLAGGRNSTASIAKKFGEPVVHAVTDYFRRTLSFEGSKTTYEKIYVATFWSAPVIRDVKQIGVRVIPLPDFICNTVLPTVLRWKSNPPHQPRTIGHRITLPESLWLLQMLDHLKGKGMLCEERMVEEAEQPVAADTASRRRRTGTFGHKGSRHSNGISSSSQVP